MEIRLAPEVLGDHGFKSDRCGMEILHGVKGPLVIPVIQIGPLRNGNQ